MCPPQLSREAVALCSAPIFRGVTLRSSLHAPLGDETRPWPVRCFAALGASRAQCDEDSVNGTHTYIFRMKNMKAGCLTP